VTSKAIEEFSDAKIDPKALDLLSRLLDYDPRTRITAAEALAHPFLESLHDPNDEPEGAPLSPFDFEFEKFNLDLPVLRDLLLDEVILSQSERAVKIYSLLKQEHPNGVLELYY